MAGDTGEMAQRQMSLKCQDWDSDPWVKCAPCFCQSSGEPAPRGSRYLLSGQASENARAGKATSKTTDLRPSEGTSLAQGKPGTGPGLEPRLLAPCLAPFASPFCAYCHSPGHAAPTLQFLWPGPCFHARPT